MSEGSKEQESVEYFVKLLAGKTQQEDLQATLWQDFCNTLALLSFKAIIDSKKLDGDGGVEARDKAADIVINEWKKRSMSILNAQVNQYSEMKRAPMGRLLGEAIPDEETVKIRFAEAIRNIEETARKMLLS
jgi:hypothetical protein